MNDFAIDPRHTGFTRLDLHQLFGNDNPVILDHNAFLVMRDMLPDASIADVHIYFSRSVAEEEASEEADHPAGGTREDAVLCVIRAAARARTSCAYLYSYVLCGTMESL